MKKGIFTILMLSVLTKFSAQTCDELKLENQQLKDKLQQYGITLNSNTIVNSFSNDIKINFIKCVGDKKQQTVTVFFNFTNNTLPNQSLTLMDNFFDGRNALYAGALDEIGNGYKPIKAKFGPNDGFFSSTTLSTGNAPIMASITFANILPDIKKLSAVNIFVKSQNLLGGDNRIEGLAEIKNIIIDWK